MAVDPLGPMSIALSKTREIVASSPEFISRAADADIDDPTSIVFLDDRPAPAADEDPPITMWAIAFEWLGDTEYEVTRLRAERGSTMLSLFRQRPEDLADSREEALMDFRNFAGVVITDILTLAKTPISGGASFFLGVHKITQIVPSGWCEPADDRPGDPWLMATFKLDWV